MAGTGGFDTTQVSVGASATQIVPRRVGRSAVTVINLSTTDVWLGNNASVTSGNGALLVGVKGAAVTIHSQSEVWGIAASSESVSVIENY